MGNRTRDKIVESARDYAKQYASAQFVQQASLIVCHNVDGGLMYRIMQHHGHDGPIREQSLYDIVKLIAVGLETASQKETN